MISGSSGYLDTAAPGVQFTHIKTYFNVPSIAAASSCQTETPGYGNSESVGIGDTEQQIVGAFVAVGGCNGATVADFAYNVPGYGAYYYSGPNPGDAMELSITVNTSGQYRIQVLDLTTGHSLQVTMGCHVSSCPDSTAMVLSSEGNLGGDGGLPTPDFAMVNFTGAAVGANFGRYRGSLAANLDSRSGN